MGKPAGNISIAFIGAGNVAWHLAPAFENLGIPVAEVYSRSKKSAKELINRLYNANHRTSLDFSSSSCTWFFIATPDNVIEEIAKEIVLPENAVLLHSSGSTSIESLQYAVASEFGVFYPFQSFTRGKKIDLRDVPFLIEASSSGLEKQLIWVGKKISRTVLTCNSHNRSYLHLAGVFASNFSNHMLTIAQDIAKENGFSEKLILPLVAETINKSLQIGPENAQTGPAIRHDYNTIEQHQEMLDEHGSWKAIYHIISRDIMNKYEDPDGEGT